jgi:hypothetical protein
MELTKQELEILAALVANAQTSVKDAVPALELWEKLKKMIAEAKDEIL